MPTVNVPLRERAYDVIIEHGCLSQIRKFDFADEVAVLGNETTGPLYGEPLSAELRQAPNGGKRRVLRFDEPDGEAYKSIEWVENAYNALAEFGLTRRGTVVAVGGGVVGDWAGFVAATWMRGVSFVQVPTTLLAMVDSSVGGKTGVNHPRAKNLIGAFHQPARVYCDPQCLTTLPQRELRAGMAEVIKYGVIADAEFFGWLEQNVGAALALEETPLLHAIQRSVELKAEIVGEDERESDAIGRRAILNYGHTVGHAIEACTRYGDFLHGEAIAIGMTVALRLAIQLGAIENADGHDLLRRQTKLFEAAALPTAVSPGIEFEALWRAMTLDKKSRGASVNFLLPTRLGEVARFDDIAPAAVQRAFSD